MTPNIEGRRYSRILLVAGVVRSALLYVIRVWKEALACDNNQRRVNMTYRLVALKICSASQVGSVSQRGDETYCLYEKRIVNLPKKDTEYRSTTKRLSLEN